MNNSWLLFIFKSETNSFITTKKAATYSCFFCGYK